MCLGHSCCLTRSSPPPRVVLATTSETASATIAVMRTVPQPSPPPPARDNNHGTSPHGEAIQRIILCACLEEGGCGGGAIFPDPTSSSSMYGTSMMDPLPLFLSTSPSSMDGRSMMDLPLWVALVTVG